MADIVRISDGGQICIVESELEAALEVVGNLVVTGSCTCGEALQLYGYLYTEHVDGSYEGKDSDGTRSRPWVTIQDAVDHSETKTRIFISRGEYTENVTIPPNMDLLFQGASRKTVFVESAAAWGSDNGPVFSQDTPGSTASLAFMELTIRLGSHGLHVNAAEKVTVERCDFYNNGWSGMEVSITDTDQATFASKSTWLENFWNGPEVSSNKAAAAIHLTDVRDVQIHNNAFAYNLHGIVTVDCGSDHTFSRLYENVVASSLSIGIVLDSSTASAAMGCENISVSDTIVHGAGFRGVQVVGGTNNQVFRCAVQNCWLGGIVLSSVSDSMVENCRLKNCSLGPYATSGGSGTEPYGQWESGAIVVTGDSGRTNASYTARVVSCVMTATGLGVPHQTRGLVLGKSLSNIQGANILLTGNRMTGFDIATHFLRGAITNPDGVTVVNVTHTKNSYEVGNKRNLVNDDRGSYVEPPFSNLYTNASNGINIIPMPCARSVLIEPNGNLFSFNQLYATRKPDNRIVIREKYQDGGNRIQFDDIDPCSVYINGKHIRVFGCPFPSPAAVNAVVDDINAALTFDCYGNEAPHFLGSFLFSVVEDQQVDFLPIVSGGGITFSVEGLPPGLSMNDTTGRIQGTAPNYITNGNNTYTWTMTAKNNYGSETATFAMFVQEDVGSVFSEKSVRFDGAGANQYIELTQTIGNFPMNKGHYRNSNVNDAWTLSLWLKPDPSTSGGEMAVFEYGLLRSKITGNGPNRTVGVTIGTPYNYIDVQAVNRLPIGGWHHLVITYNGGACGVASDRVETYYRAFKIYVDGQEFSREEDNVVCSQSNYGFGDVNIAREFYLGRDFHGLMDEVILTPGALADAQVEALFNNGEPEDPWVLDPGNIWGWNIDAPEARWWRMGDGTHPDAWPELYDEFHVSESGSAYVLQMVGMLLSHIVNEGAEV